ncbi:MAG: hydroxyisourate hydrolase [Myxococcales bacterium]|nr:hydroxyisourate hydrolase [Myxococcales bacterium]
MSAITTHVLDTARGRPAQGVPIVLERQEAHGFVEVSQGRTDADGRVADLLGARSLQTGVWRLTFDTDAYFATLGVPAFYPEVRICFRVARADEHHHVPLLLAPFGYSTYRGS